MDHAPNSGLSRDIAAAFAWWTDAGVDHDYADDPADWLARPAAQGTPAEAGQPATLPVVARPAASLPPATLQPPPLAQADWPRDLDAFSRWWLEEPALDQGRLTGRVPPRGNRGARLMVVVEQPEAGDSETLLSGPQGRLLADMLAAMGIAPETSRIASVLVRHTPMPDWAGLAQAGFGDLLAHHIALAAPERLILLGSNILPLVGNNLTNFAENLPRFNHEGQSIPVFAARGLPALLERPRWKSGVWQGWLDWMRKDPPRTTP